MTRKGLEMIYVKNLPLWERALRIGAGSAVAAYPILHGAGTWDGWGWAVAAAGAGAALTGIFGFCPACALAGRRLDKRNRQTGEERTAS